MGEGLSQGHTVPQGAERRLDPEVPQNCDCAGVPAVGGGVARRGFNATEPGDSTPPPQSNQVGGNMTPQGPLLTSQHKSNIQLGFYQLEREETGGQVVKGSETFQNSEIRPVIGRVPRE